MHFAFAARVLRHRTVRCVGQTLVVALAVVMRHQIYADRFSECYELFVLSGKTTVADRGFSLISNDILYPLAPARVIGEIWPVTFEKVSDA